MYKTKTAWKVVSDPYAPEAHWAPACAEAVTSEEPWYVFQGYRERKEKSTGKKVGEAIVLSSALALLGGAFAGQCVHVNYYAQHLFGQFFFSEFAFEPWGAFYYWYNQANAVCTYVPIFFAYSMGFWSSINDLGKKFDFMSGVMVALYLVSIYCIHCFLPFVQEQEPYCLLLLASGMVGSAAAFCLGKTIAKNVAAVISPRLIFVAMFSIFFPMVLSIPPFMSNFAVVASVSVLAVLLLGYLIRRMHSGSLKTSILLSLTAASPLVLCGLMHFPMATWFGNVFAQTYGLGIAFSRDLFYYLLLPGAALVLPVLGTVIAHALNPVAHGSDFSTRTLTAEELISLEQGMQSTEEPSLKQPLS